MQRSGSGGGPAPPTVTISASATTVNEGESVELTWSSTGATSCAASGGWSGNQATSGSATSPPVVGWSDSGQLIGPRDAAPFAILEDILKGINLVLEADPSADFPDLTIDWGPENVGGETFFTTNLDGSNPRIVLWTPPASYAAAWS